VTRILAEQLGQTESRGAIAKVILAAQVATLAIYVLAPAAIRLSGWRMVFLAAGAAGVASVLLWYGGTAGLTQKAAGRVQKTAQARAGVGRLILEAGLIPMMIAILLMGMLRDGLQTWMPTYICEVFGLSTETSILISGLLPVVSMAAITLSTMLLQRSNNEPLSGALFFAVGFVAAAIMVVIFPGGAVVGVALFVVLAGSMHGVNQLIICYTPAHLSPTAVWPPSPAFSTALCMWAPPCPPTALPCSPNASAGRSPSVPGSWSPVSVRLCAPSASAPGRNFPPGHVHNLFSRFSAGQNRVLRR